MITQKPPLKQMNRHPSLSLVLASSSPYRREMLGRLGLAFESIAPDVDEQRHRGETPIALARRLALQKAVAVASQRPEATVIGADQVLDLDGACLGKPGGHEAAREQLKSLAGRRAVFYSAMAIIWPQGRLLSVTPCEARFLPLTAVEIEAYLQAERPYDTAGSAKAEGLGIALLESLSSDDPTAIIGLPLIGLAQMLRRAGINPLTKTNSVS